MRAFMAAAALRAQGVDVVDFSAGDPDFPTPEHIKQAAIRAIQENFTRYTSSGGTEELRQAVCDRHAQDLGTAYRPPECVVSVGGKHAVFNLIQVLVSPGDEVLIPVPFWVTYKDAVEYAGGQCVFVETEEGNGFALTAALVERQLTPRTRMVVINSPCNPSGAVLARLEFERLLEMTSARGIYLLSDECYARLLYQGAPFSVASLPGSKETVIVAGSLSKTYAMTGWRIGFGLGPESIIQAVVKLQSHSTSNPTSVSQKAAVEALRGPQDAVDRMLGE
jgi:aspartate aminotransferase